MRKLRLEIDALRVESFGTTGAGGDGRGTVHGNWRQSVDVCEPVEPIDPFYTEDPAGCATVAYTCAASCNGSCNSCYGTCYSCYGTCGWSCQRTCDPSCNLCEPVYPEP